MDGEPSFERNIWRGQRLRGAEFILALELDDHAVVEGFLARIADSSGRTLVLRWTAKVLQ